MGKIYEYAIEMGSNAMIHIPNFMKIGSGIQVKKGDSQTPRQHGDCISILFFLKLRKVD
jgi:hypothetical protein